MHRKRLKKIVLGLLLFVGLFLLLDPLAMFENSKRVEKSTGDVSFPQGFLWGAATASHQIEGNTHNDWSVWEKENAQRLANNAENKYRQLVPDWDRIQSEAVSPSNYISANADESYERYKEDFDLAKELGLSAYRFSIEWSRVEPEEGKFDEAVLAHYKDEIQALRERGIEPFVTLWHWTLPVWFADKGGWKNNEASTYFNRYVEQVVKVFGSEVQFWITLNEPQVYLSMPYYIKDPPSQDRNPLTFLKVRSHLADGHKKAYQTIKAHSASAQVGIANHTAYFEAYKDRPINRLIVTVASWLMNTSFLNKIKDQQDFIGVNYYFHRTFDYGFLKKTEAPLSDQGWELYPEGVYHVLKLLEHYNKPLYITEHGLSDAQDQYRSWYISESLRYAHKAIQEGVPLKGYFHWSLLDNFEWADGYWPKFGLIEVDRTTQKRTIRQSALDYAAIVKANGLKK